jgi:hypothetical protein
MKMLGEPAAPRMDPEAVVGVLGWDDAWDGLGRVLAGLLMPMGCAVLLWRRGALPGGGGPAAAAAAGDAMTACALDGDAGACILPWESEPEAKEVPTSSPSCLPRGVGGAEAEGVSLLTEGGGRGAEEGDSVSADLLWLVLLPPLPYPEGLPGEEEELIGLSLMGVPDMRSQMLMGPAQGRGGGGDSRIRVVQTTPVQSSTPTAKGRN